LLLRTNKVMPLSLSRFANKKIRVTNSVRMDLLMSNEHS